MNTTDYIGIANVIAQLIVAGVAIWAVLASLNANKRQIAASEKQLKKQIDASDFQIRQQIEENRRLATEERQHQSRPIIAPRGEVLGNAITYISMETGMANEALYAQDGRISW